MKKTVTIMSLVTASLGQGAVAATCSESPVAAIRADAGPEHIMYVESVLSSKEYTATTMGREQLITTVIPERIAGYWREVNVAFQRLPTHRLDFALRLDDRIIGYIRFDGEGRVVRVADTPAGLGDGNARPLVLSTIIAHGEAQRTLGIDVSAVRCLGSTFYSRKPVRFF